MDAMPAHSNAAYARCRAIHRTYDAAFYIGCKMLRRHGPDALQRHPRRLGRRRLPGLRR